MHDLDRTLRTYEREYAFDSGEIGLDPEIFGEVSTDREGSGELSTEEELGLAHELLALEGEEELDHFLGKIFKKVAGAGGKRFFSSLGKVLKPIAKQALPIVGKVAGSFFGGPVGGMIGSKLGSLASNLFEVNFEAMEPGEAQVEAARRFVRLAYQSARQADRALAGTSNPVAAARSAVSVAARTYAPGLLKGALAGPAQGAGLSRPQPGGRPAVCTCGANRTSGGRWIRRGDQVLAIGA